MIYKPWYSSTFPLSVLVYFYVDFEEIYLLRSLSGCDFRKISSYNSFSDHGAQTPKPPSVQQLYIYIYVIRDFCGISAWVWEFYSTIRLSFWSDFQERGGGWSTWSFFFFDEIECKKGRTRMMQPLWISKYPRKNTYYVRKLTSSDSERIDSALFSRNSDSRDVQPQNCKYSTLNLKIPQTSWTSQPTKYSDWGNSLRRHSPKRTLDSEAKTT